jgi:transcriptional regulator with GAF, ATPase, and Fis domain
MFLRRSVSVLVNNAIFPKFNQLLLEMAHQHSVDRLLSLVTSCLSTFLDVALVRIWLLLPADECGACRIKASCQAEDKCLHLVASAGKSIVDDVVWNTTDGEFSRLGSGSRIIERIVKTGKPCEIMEVDPNESWVANPDWIRREQICSYGGHPLIFRDEVLGVLAIFTRSPFDSSTFFLLRMVADHLAHAIVNARAFEEIDTLKERLEMENKYLLAEACKRQKRLDFVGKSVSFHRILEKISLVAPTDSNVFIYGETGTGKELAAQEIHRLSNRSGKPMIKVNCSAVPSELFSSEFFGHVKGAFTGAVKDKIGYFRAADGGTLFLDEVTEMPCAQQSVLLRVLQDGEYRRVGDEKTYRVNVRIIAATNQNPEENVKSGRLRADLYYRLHVFPIEIPPLRHRKEDVIPLAEYFLKEFSKRIGKNGQVFSQENINAMINYAWPGNVRQLQNIIEYAVITARSGSNGFELGLPVCDMPVQYPVTNFHPSRSALSEAAIRRLEQDNLMIALEHCNFKVYGPNGAAEFLGVKPTTLIARMKKSGINRARAGGLSQK